MFAKKAGIREVLANTILGGLQEAYRIPEMVDRSFMSKEIKNKYKKVYLERISRLKLT